MHNLMSFITCNLLRGTNICSRCVNYGIILFHYCKFHNIHIHIHIIRTYAAAGEFSLPTLHTHCRSSQMRCIRTENHMKLQCFWVFLQCYFTVFHLTTPRDLMSKYLTIVTGWSSTLSTIF